MQSSLKRDWSVIIVNWLLNLLIIPIALIIIPIQIISTFVLGILVNLTFGLLIIPINLMWLMLFGPLLALSWLWWKAPLLRIFIALIGVPLALIAHIYTCVMPCMGEMDARYVRILNCEVWPCTIQCFYIACRRPISNIHERYQFFYILNRTAQSNRSLQPLVREYLHRLMIEFPPSESEEIINHEKLVTASSGIG